ncbi:DUF4188 domain-containing protein [Plectonema cf. radiosum LEGE 06105]|uniref:DUF4188 domain-containing protein n=1 Tax=Plectonema cf. radiosum LEGE 06105 TaxID=945769 RepID=A0A8J7K2K6_9CYAN|nr:DUF4188 domain-containing protein [Plectonema radiosum]MBE9214327.1 DUF4188 domain-containing protein [Plectonema cf. radiosum LEGE 06105]
MSQVMSGRFTAETSEPFLVFLIGMRINKLFAVNKWVPTAMAMTPMLRTLYEHPEKGFLGGESFLYWRGVGLIQYWRSFEDLERFARSPEEPHLKAWQRFNRVVGADGSVGIWHETYLINPGNYKAIYGNMPIFGLAAATKHISVTERKESAPRRVGNI